MTTFDDSQTPQTTRCPKCACIQFGERGSGPECLGPTERYCLKCGTVVPAPSAPARARERVELKTVDGAVVATVTLAKRPVRGARFVMNGVEDWLMSLAYVIERASGILGACISDENIADILALAPATAAQEAQKPWGWVYSDNGCDFTLLWDDALIAELREAGKTVLPLYTVPVAPATAEPTAEKVAWKPIATAPKDATWVVAKLADGEIVAAHWACDYSGEEQPVFEGWYRYGNDFFREVKPVEWLSRGSGPVGQAKRIQVPACDKCTQGVMDATNPHLLGTCQCACHTPSVAASAEAKRIDAPEVRKALAGLVRMARSAAQSDRTVEFVDKSEAIITNALTAALASPESGV